MCFQSPRIIERVAGDFPIPLRLSQLKYWNATHSETHDMGRHILKYETHLNLVRTGLHRNEGQLRHGCNTYT
jgi:hypothetical protein